MCMLNVLNSTRINKTVLWPDDSQPTDCHSGRGRGRCNSVKGATQQLFFFWGGRWVAV